MIANYDRERLSDFYGIGERTGFASLDALGSLVSTVRREWGESGYSVSVLGADYGSAVVRVLHSDGSRFDLKSDRYGNVEYVGRA